MIDHPAADFVAAVQHALRNHLADPLVAAALVAVERVLVQGEDPADVNAWLTDFTTRERQP